ncbi:MAG TPA: sigma-54 dependent transcriptional regulator [Gemmatimonadaceae bacterium]|nr:sigma-54 dependent transcriptional regulator [Gemmatimonadaceae bacterium]
MSRAANSSPPAPAARILVADDQGDVIEAIRLLTSEVGYEVIGAQTVADAVAAAEAHELDAALVDLNYSRDTTSGREGMELIERLRGVDGTLPVIAMTAWGSIAGAVDAMRRGAKDYIEKPWDDDRLLSVLRVQIELGRALRRTQRLEAENARLNRRGLPTLVARGPQMQPILEMMERVAPSDANVLITGEHGTGKEVVAQWLHAASNRADKPLVAVNVGGLSEGLAESEFFGHVKGAFTDAKSDRIGCFELADSGTLFLDEIANTSVRLQAKLLRVLQTGEVQRVGSSRTRHVDVRVLSATNANLADEIARGAFREDLLFRLNTIVLHLPPLRERREDIAPLAEYFLAHYATRYRKGITSFDGTAMREMERHVWPGNVRELAHTVERAVLLASGTSITARDLGLQSQAAGGAAAEEAMTLEDAERLFIRKVLAQHHGNVQRAAEQLGVSRSALYRRIQQYGL